MNRLQMNDQPFFSRDEKDLMMENPIKVRLNAGQQLLRLFADFDDAIPLIPPPPGDHLDGQDLFKDKNRK